MDTASEAQSEDCLGELKPVVMQPLKTSFLTNITVLNQF
jgi:hypothetical protein